MGQPQRHQPLLAGVWQLKPSPLQFWPAMQDFAGCFALLLPLLLLLIA
jgi:hypothetical protein